MLKTVIFWLEFTLSFYEIVQDETGKVVNTKFGSQWKNSESIYQARQILAYFCKLGALMLRENYLKGLRVTKIVKQLKFQGSLRWVKNKKLFAEIIILKIFGTNCNFHVKYSTLQENSISVLQEIFTSTDKILILEGGMNTRQQLYKILRFPWYFLIS